MIGVLLTGIVAILQQFLPSRPEFALAGRGALPADSPPVPGHRRKADALVDADCGAFDRASRTSRPRGTAMRLAEDGKAQLRVFLRARHPALSR